jgi:hypothetical protein
MRLAGLAFEITDLVAVGDWAVRNDVRMAIRLDHGVEGEEYEEVIVLHSGTENCLLLLWRDETTTYLQPVPGRRACFASVTDALDKLGTKPTRRVTGRDKAAVPSTNPERDHVQS